MITTVYKQPLVEPISLTEAKLHLKVDSSVTADDTLITSQITAARQFCESYERATYITKQFKMYLDGFPAGDIELPFSPANYVDSVQYYDSVGSLQTLASTYYTVDIDSIPARVYLAYNQTWPSTYDIPKSVIITYTAGYASKFITTYSAGPPAAVTNTIYGRTLTNGDLVRVCTSSGTLPTGISADTDYYVISVSDQTFAFSLTSGGSAVSITASSSGACYVGSLVPERVKCAMKLILTHLYENRIEVSELNFKQIPMGAKHLLFERQF